MARKRYVPRLALGRHQQPVCQVQHDSRDHPLCEESREHEHQHAERELRPVMGGIVLLDEIEKSVWVHARRSWR